MIKTREKICVVDNAQLMAEWSWKKNDELQFSPKILTTGSNKKVWWKCSKGHEWQATINSRNNGIGCPYCSGRFAIKGQNDLQTVNPTLAKEWNFEKNNGLKPTDVMPNSDKKVWWVCSKGHEWQASIGSRNRGNGCPVCHSEQNTSFPEYAIVFYLKKYGLETIHCCREFKGIIQAVPKRVHIPSIVVRQLKDRFEIFMQLPQGLYPRKIQCNVFHPKFSVPIS